MCVYTLVYALTSLAVQFSCSVVSNSLWPMVCSTPGLPVHHQLPEFTQIHVHWAGDDIQPSHPLFLLSILPSIRVFSNKSVLRIKWPKNWSFSFSISPSMDIWDSFPLGWTGWISLQLKGLSRVFSNTTVQKHQFFNAWLYRFIYRLPRWR